MGTQSMILIVEGHAGVHEALARRLQRVPGIRVVAAAGERDVAMRLAQELLPDAVIYDPQTAAGDAAAAMRLLRRGGCPVIVLTCWVGDRDRAALLRAGAAAVVLMGLPFPALLTEIEAAVAKCDAAAHRTAAP